MSYYGHSIVCLDNESCDRRVIRTKVQTNIIIIDASLATVGPHGNSHKPK